MVIPVIFLFHVTVWPLLRPDDSWKRTVNYCRLERWAALVAVSVTDVVLLLEQINKATGTLYVAYFSILLWRKRDQKQFTFMGER